MNTENYLGIDPGKSGALALISTCGKYYESYYMPETTKDLVQLLNDLVGCPDKIILHAVLEDVHAMPKDSAKGAFSFGKNVGELQMGLAMANIPHTLVSPQKWQKDLNCLTHGNKNVTKEKAQQLFPEEKITHRNADALLLAEWLRRQRKDLD